MRAGGHSFGALNHDGDKGGSRPRIEPGRHLGFSREKTKKSDHFPPAVLGSSTPALCHARRGWSAPRHTPSSLGIRAHLTPNKKPQRTIKISVRLQLLSLPREYCNRKCTPFRIFLGKKNKKTTRRHTHSTTLPIPNTINQITK